VEKLDPPHGRIMMLATVQSPRQPNLKFYEILPFHGHKKQRKGAGFVDPAGVVLEGGAVVVVVEFGGPLGWTVVFVERLHAESLQRSPVGRQNYADASSGKTRQNEARLLLMLSTECSQVAALLDMRMPATCHMPTATCNGEDKQESGVVDDTVAVLRGPVP